jgi:hypothetical protein
MIKGVLGTFQVRVVGGWRKVSLQPASRETPGEKTNFGLGSNKSNSMTVVHDVKQFTNPSKSLDMNIVFVRACYLEKKDLWLIM